MREQSPPHSWGLSLIWKAALLSCMPAGRCCSATCCRGAAPPPVLLLLP